MSVRVTAGPGGQSFLLPVTLFEGYSLFFLTGKPPYYLQFFKGRKIAEEYKKKKKKPLNLSSVPPWLVGTICLAFFFEQPLVICVGEPSAQVWLSSQSSNQLTSQLSLGRFC